MPRVESRLVLVLFLLLPLVFVQNNPNAYQQDPMKSLGEKNPLDKIDPELRDILNDFSRMGEVVEVIVMWNPSSAPSLSVFANRLSTIEHVKVTSTFEVAECVLARVRVSSILNLASRGDVRFVWANQRIKVDNLPPKFNPLGSPRASSSGEFVNFTEDTGARDLWSLGYNGSNVNIAILDTGVDITGNLGDYGGDLDDFDENTSTSDYKFIGSVSMLPHEPLYYTDFNGRGTFHAGVATGTGYWNSSYVGMAPGAHYLNVKVFDSGGFTYWSFVLSGIDWSMKHGADVILFCASIPGYYDDPVSVAINNAVEAGIVVVAPAGDDGPGYMSIDTPGQAIRAITVGAYNTSSGGIASFSSRGPTFDFRSGPDVVAPGVDLISVRSKLFAESYDNIGKMFGSLGFDIEDMLGFSFGGAIPADSFPTPEYGEPVNENYTRASGTGAASAVVAGGVAILLQAFPLATPELIRIALEKTAVKLGNDENTEGAGLIDLVSAYQYLERYMAAGEIESFPISSPLVYPGVVMSADVYNITGNTSVDEWPDDFFGYDTGLMISTQLMASTAFVTNVSDTNFTAIHLPLNQFGVKFTSDYNSTPLVPMMEPVTGERFAWFSQFNVLREMHIVTEQGPMGPEQYMRYAGVLQYEHLLALVTVEQYSYSVTYDELKQTYFINDTSWFDVNNRINAYKFTIDFFNLGDEPIKDLELFSYFKSDLYLNETGVLETDLGSSEIGGIMNASLDDTIEYENVNREVFVTWDENNNTDFNDRYAENFTAMGFNSTTHAVNGYEISPAIDLLMNVTMNQTLYNTTDYQQNMDDPGFAVNYILTDSLSKDAHVTWGGILGIGVGHNETDAKTSLYKQMDLLNGNVTTYNISDVMIVDANFSRVVHEQEVFESGALFINAGNTVIEDLQVVFMANRTNEDGGLEVFSVIFEESNIAPLTLLRYKAQWVPLYTDVYSVGWAISQLDSSSFFDIDPFNFKPEMLLLNQETAILNNFFTRNVYVVRRSQYEGWAKQTFQISPGTLPLASFTLHHPGDFGMVNLTALASERILGVDVSFTSIGGVFATLNKSSFPVLNPYDRIQLTLMVPLFAPKGTFYFEVVLTCNGTDLARIPVQFSVEPSRGRVFFDGIHSDLFSLLGEDPSTLLNTSFDTSSYNLSEGTNFDEQIIDRIWGERLETTYGNFFQTKEMWATREMGATVMTVIPILEVNMSEYFDIGSALPEGTSDMMGEGGLGFGPYSFESDILSLKWINHDILQFFDLLVIQDPEKEFTSAEREDITAWVEAGGVLMVFAENETENNVTAINELLSPFNLKIDRNTTHGVTLDGNNWTTHANSALFQGVTRIALDDPVNFTTAGGSATVDFLCDGNYMAETKYGAGKVLAIGDRDVLSAGNLANESNRIFANNCLTWAFERHFDFSVEGLNSSILFGAQNYFYLQLENYATMNQYLTDGKFLALAAFVDSSGNSINASFFGYEIPVMPFMETDTGYLGAYYDSTWSKTNYTGTVYVEIILDHPAVASEILFFTFTVIPAEKKDYDDYQFPNPLYPQIYDLIGILSVVAMGVFLWSYKNYKNKRRLQITELKGELLYQARTIINEGQTIVKQLDFGLAVEDVEEIEKIRILLSSRKHVKEYFDQLKKFGDELGEFY
ncbi:MAG: DUF4350 domain-containing protein [Promethearchaeota archaeon]